MEIANVYDQPKEVLAEYAQYVQGKIEMGEIPFSFDLWADIETTDGSPIGQKININH
jgi:hypothetical protein